MNNIKKRYVIILLIILSMVFIIGSSKPFRFSETHSIIRQSNCFPCHLDQLNDSAMGRHIGAMNYTQNTSLFDYIYIYGNLSSEYNQAITLDGVCYSCHVTYLNYKMFGLTDPYRYTIDNYTISMGDLNNTVDLSDAQYGYLIKWPAINNSTTYFDTDNNTSLSVKLEILSVSPANFTVDSTVKVVLANYSGHQTGNATYDSTILMAEGETMSLNISNINEDYFKIIVILDGFWNQTTVNLRLNDTDKGIESFIFTANTHPYVYELPFNDTGVYYFKTNGTYKATRLDYVFDEWLNYLINNITTSETIRTNTTNGWISANTCSSPNTMCHINQKATYIGITDQINSYESFYKHQMEYVTSKRCDSCHLKNKLLI